MKKNYINPAIEMISLANEDVLTASTDLAKNPFEDLFPAQNV